MNKKYYHALIGFSSIIIMTVLFLLLLFITSDKQKKITLMAKFNDISGVIVGSKLLLSGIDIGHVRQIDIDENSYQAIIMLDVSDNYLIPIDSSIAILSNGFFGEKYLRISPGGDEKTMQNNDYFSYTQDTLNLLSTLEMIIKNAEEKAGIIPSENNLNPKDKWS